MSYPGFIEKVLYQHKPMFDCDEGARRAIKHGFQKLGITNVKTTHKDV
jgi:hypothetical protein